MCIFVFKYLFRVYYLIASVRLSFTLRIALQLSSKNRLGIYLGRYRYIMNYTPQCATFSGVNFSEGHTFILCKLYTYQHIILLRVLSSKLSRVVFTLYWYILYSCRLNGGITEYRNATHFSILLFGMVIMRIV